MKNYIKLNRSIQKWGWYKDSSTKCVFIELLLRARFEPGEYRETELKVGQCVFGRKELAECLGLSEQSVRTAIDHLKSTNEITITPTNKYSVVTIVNWEKYQGKENEVTSKSTKWLTNNQPTTNQQLTTNKECKKEIIKESYCYSNARAREENDNNNYVLGIASIPPEERKGMFAPSDERYEAFISRFRRADLGNKTVLEFMEEGDE